MAFPFALFIVAFCTTVVVSEAASHPWVAEARDQNWLNHHQALLATTKKHATEIEVVFLGDSITQGWSYNGKQLWQEHYQPRHAFNYGIGGDRTENILWRIANGEFDGVKPKLICLMIGTNNIPRNNATDIAKGIHTILEALHTKMPSAKILLQSVLPRHTHAMDQEVHDINGLIARFADRTRVYYLDLAVHFETSLAHEKAELFVADHAHLSEKGYAMWYKVMEPTFKKLIA